MPGDFARVSSGYEWIQATVCKTSNDPPGSLCGEPTYAPTTRMPTRVSGWLRISLGLGSCSNESHSMITFPCIATQGLRGNLPRCLLPECLPEVSGWLRISLGLGSCSNEPHSMTTFPYIATRAHKETYPDCSTPQIVPPIV
jgi:hypothetical protein